MWSGGGWNGVTREILDIKSSSLSVEVSCIWIQSVCHTCRTAGLRQVSLMINITTKTWKLNYALKYLLHLHHNAAPHPSKSCVTLSSEKVNGNISDVVLIFTWNITQNDKDIHFLYVDPAPWVILTIKRYFTFCMKYLSKMYYLSLTSICCNS